MSTLQELIDGHYRGLNAHDVDQGTAPFSEDVSVMLPTGSFQGIDGLRAAMSAFFTAFPDLAVLPRRVVNDGVTAMTEMTLTGTQDGPLAMGEGEVPPSGRAVSLPIVDTFVLEGERIVEHNVYWDNLAFMTQLGLMPES